MDRPRARREGRDRSCRARADPVVVERVRLRGAVLAHVVLTPRRFVDVVAEVHDQIEVVGDHVPVRGEVALLVLLAGGESEPQALVVLARGGRGARPADRTHLTAGAKSIPVPARRLEALHLDVDRVCERGCGGGDAALDDFRHTLVGRHFPFARHDLGRHAASGHERRRSQACPEHHTCRGGIAGCDAERERRTRQSRLGREAADERWRGVRDTEREPAGHEISSPNARGCRRPDRHHRPAQHSRRGASATRNSWRRSRERKSRPRGRAALVGSSWISCAGTRSSSRGRHAGCAWWCRSSGLDRRARASTRTAGSWSGRPGRSSSCGYE